MRNLMKKTVCGILAVLMVMSFAACADTQPSDGGADVPAADSGASSVDSGAASLSDAEQAVADYVESMKSAVESASNNDMLTCSLEARGTALVYKYTYKSISEIPEESKTAIIDALDAAVTDSLKSQIKAEIPEAESIVYEYYGSNGDFLVEKEYAL